MSPEMKQTYDVRVKEFIPLIPPQSLKDEIPISQAAGETVIAGREAIERILRKEDQAPPGDRRALLHPR